MGLLFPTPHSQFAREAAAILSAPLAAVGPEQLAARRDSLPEPVRRYLGFAIGRDAPAIRTARVRHEGWFRPRPSMPQLPIRGEEYFSVAEPGFTWTARVRPTRFYWMDARDCYLGGKGNMLVKLMSVIPVADARGPELDHGAAHRWLAEAVWFPYAFVAECVDWGPVDANSARVTLRCAGLPVSALLEVDGEGRPVAWKADRHRDLGGGKSALTPWIVRAKDYWDIGGFRVPTDTEVSWLIDDSELCYARFKVTSVEYNVGSHV